MRINTNISALNTHRMMGITHRESGKNLEKLSSGKRLNRSSDDAAGLAISEKMQAQIRGLRMASKNSLDGMSLIQTAEGALNEVHAMLQRMRELAVYAANGSLALEDREAIQNEINQLTSQINTVGQGTEFNKMTLLEGNSGPKAHTIDGEITTGEPARVTGTATIGNYIFTQLDNKELTIEINGKKAQVNLEGFAGGAAAPSKEELLERIKDAVGFDAKVYFNDNSKIVLETNEPGGEQNIKISGTAAADVFGGESTVSGKAENPSKYAQGYLIFEKVPDAGSSIVIGDKRIEFYDSSKGPYGGTNLAIDIKGKTKANIVDEIAEKRIPGVAFGIDNGMKNLPHPIPGGFPNVIINENNAAKIRIISHKKGFEGKLLRLEGTPKDFRVDLQVGANERQSFLLHIGDCRSKALRISGSKSSVNPGVEGAAYTKTATVTGKNGGKLEEYAIDVTDEKKASAAITVFSNAISKISEERSRMGAIQNRLEKTIANLDNTAENLTAAQSRIADTDMALEMSEFTKLNIMQQAGTAMLAQANQQPQMLLKLLNA